MAKEHGHVSAAERGIAVGHAGFASLLFAVARPADARASILDGNTLRLTFPIGLLLRGVRCRFADSWSEGWSRRRCSGRAAARSACRDLAN